MLHCRTVFPLQIPVEQSFSAEMCWFISAIFSVPSVFSVVILEREMKPSFPGLYGFFRRLIGLAMGFYFRRIERFHAERVPASGPVLLTSNHPSSLMDPFMLGESVPRKVNFVATVQLFKIKPLAWLLTQCGVIPINRVKDD